MNLPIPYSPPQKKEDLSPKEELSPAEDYFRYRVKNRFLRVMGLGIKKVSDEHARKIAEVNLRVGKALNDTLIKGFEGVQKHQVEIHGALIDQTQVIQSGFDQVEVAIYAGAKQVSAELNHISQEIEGVNEALLATGERLAQGISGLKAAVDMGMVSIVSQFELQREALQEGFLQLSNLMENQHKTAAQERYLDGKLAYEQFLAYPDEPQFLTDALDYFQQSITAYRGNPYCHLYLGHIYHEAAAYYDLALAKEHYGLCATYAKGTHNKSLAALGYFLAAWIAFVSGEAEDALTLGLQSIEYDPTGLPEAWYNVAKYYAAKEETESALYYLDYAVRHFDPLYTLKASLDLDFVPIKAALDTYFLQIRDEEADLLAEKMRNFGL